MAEVVIQAFPLVLSSEGLHGIAYFVINGVAIFINLDLKDTRLEIGKFTITFINLVIVRNKGGKVNQVFHTRIIVSVNAHENGIINGGMRFKRQTNLGILIKKGESDQAIQRLTGGGSHNGFTRNYELSWFIRQFYTTHFLIIGNFIQPIHLTGQLNRGINYQTVEIGLEIDILEQIGVLRFLESLCNAINMRSVLAKPPAINVVTPRHWTIAFLKHALFVSVAATRDHRLA